MKILISGSSGGIGGAVADVARSAGHVVIELNRADYARDGDIVTEDGIDAVVFATGMCPVKSVSATDDALFAETMRVNCGLFLRLMREIVARRLYSTNGMHVLAVSSVSAVEGWPGGAAYCASKGALSAMCRAMDVELRSRGISVTAIEPRYVRTAMFDNCAGRMGVPASAALSPQALAVDILTAAHVL